MPKSRILILSSRFGEGHIKAGEALQRVLEMKYSSTCEVRHLDFGSFFFRKADYLMRKAYLNMVTKTPELWRLIYEKTALVTAENCSTLVNGFGSENLLNYIKDYAPEVIVNTHFIPAGLLAEFKKKGFLDIPLATVITDYRVHGVWIHSGIDLNLAGSQDVCAQLIDAGIPSGRIALTGIPLRPCFETPLSKAEARKKLGLDQDKQTILVMGGTGSLTGRKTGIIEIAANLSWFKTLQFLIVCGADELSYKQLTSERNGNNCPVSIYGYVDNVQDFMAASDLLISKGGALTISEALTIGLPVVMFKPIPGHEYGNAAFVEKAGAGLTVNSAEELVRQLEVLLKDQDKLQKMSEAAHSLLLRHTADKTAEAILQLLRNNKCQKIAVEAIG